MPDFVGDRYYSQTARIVAVVCAIFISFTYVAGQMRGVGVVFSRFLEVDVNVGVYIGMAIVFFYAVLGGMKGITYTQVAQYCVLIFAYLVPAIFLSLLITGNPVPQLGFGDVDQASGISLLERLNGLHQELSFRVHVWNKVQIRRLLYNGSTYGRDRWSATCDHPLLYGPTCTGCPPLRRMGSRIHRSLVHNRSSGSRVRSYEPHQQRFGSTLRPGA